MDLQTTSADKATPSTEDAPLFEVEDLHKSFGKLEVLKGITLTVHKGDVLVIIGPSGSGKSTLSRILVGLEPFDRGEIRVHGQVFATITERGRLRLGSNNSSLRLAMGMVFQHFTLFPNMTVMKNVTLAPRRVRKKSKAQAEALGAKVLELVHLSEKRDEYPSRLSGGQKQRVAIARELAMERDILFFDEPTSALDPELVREVLTTMRDLVAAGMTMVLVTHEMAFARQVGTWAVFMCDGNIVEQGTPAEVFDHPRHERTRAFLEGSVH